MWIDGVDVELWRLRSKSAPKMDMFGPWIIRIGPNRPMNRSLHIYNPRRLQQTSFDVDRCSGSRVRMFTKYNALKIDTFCPWTVHNGLNGPMNGLLHIYDSRCFQLTWYDVDRCSGGRVMVFTKKITDGQTDGRTTWFQYTPSQRVYN